MPSLLGSSSEYQEALSFVYSCLVGALVLFLGYLYLRPRRSKVDVDKEKDSLYQSWKLNDSLYELWKPSSTPDMEILFFHGLHSGDSSNAHISTWESGDGSVIWPQKWLVDVFPQAHVFCVSYDGCVKKNSTGHWDMYTIAENLVSDLMDAKIGQAPSCPVILVGHCFGGLAIKGLCLQANGKLSRSRSKTERAMLTTFLGNVKGVFYYGTPHHGSPSVYGGGNLLLTYFETLSKDAGRLGYEFNQLCTKYDWSTDGLGENLPTRWGLFTGSVVALEGSSRQGGNFNVCATDHGSISHPPSKKDRRFYALKGFVQTIANNLKVPLHETQGLPKYPIDLEKRAFDIKKKLANGGIMGICGMGGIGKTTLAKRVFNIMSKDFEYTCFIDNVKDIPNHELGDRLLNHLHHKGARVGGNQIGWSDLKEKKTLIVMDDMDSEDQFKVLPQFKDFGNGSCLIITSRAEDILKFYDNCFVYKVKFLRRKDAKKLFCHHAFGQEDIPEFLDGIYGLGENVDAVVQKCDGLPLTLEVMGCYLKGKETETKVWKEAIRKLGKAMSLNGTRNDRVWASLMLSYDALEKEEQEMFIEVATFFFERKLDYALATWPYENAKITWDNLVSKSLVKEVWAFDFRPYYDEYKEVWVHEQLRDLAKKIRSNLRDDNSMVSGVDIQADSLVNKLNAKEVRGTTKWLQILYPTIPEENRTSLELNSLVQLKDLRYVEMVGVLCEGRGEHVTRMLSLLRYEGTESIFHREFSFDIRDSTFEISLDKMGDLAVLELRRCVLPNDFPETLGNLTNLRLLFLDDLHVVRLPENFHNLSLLTRLELRSLRSLILPQSFGKLGALEDLILFEIICFKLPESFGDLSSLVILRILRCEELARLPHSFSNLKSLRKLELKCYKLEGLPDNFGDLHSLEEFTIHSGSLKVLPESMGQLHSLKKFEINAVALMMLPSSFSNLKSLGALEIICRTLERLPDNFGDLNSLEDLTIGLGLLEILPESMGQLHFLKKFKIDALRLKMLPKSFSNLKSLEKLEIECPKLERLPDNFGDLHSLEELTIKSGSLLILPESMGQLHSLKKFAIEAKALKMLPNSISNLKSLGELKIKCAKLERLPDNFGQLMALKRLHIVVDEAKTLPDSFCGLKSLKVLAISCNMEKLPDNIGDLNSLEGLTIKSDSLETLPESMGQLHYLRKLTLLRVQRVRTLPESMKQLSSLREFKLEFHGNEPTRSLFEYLSWYKHKLTLDGSCRTRTLPNDLRDLRRLPLLKSLSLLNSLCLCQWAFERLPEDIRELSSLEILEIQGCEKLESLPESLGRISTLRKVMLWSCWGLKSLPDSLGKSPSPPVALPEGHKSHETWRRTEDSGKVLLFVRLCPYLTDSLLEGLGWSSVATMATDFPCDKWYRRQRPDEESATG